MTTPLITVSQFTSWGSVPELIQDTAMWTPAALEAVVAQGSASVEARCGRRLAPFTVTESLEAWGVSPSDALGLASALPVSAGATVGMSLARALDPGLGLVSEFWLREYAPCWVDLWNYNIESAVIRTPFGSTQELSLSALTPPDPETGYFRLQLGTFCPEGSRLVVTYSGGYTATPPDLVEACLYACMKQVILAIEPGTPKGESLAELDAEITSLLAPYIRL